MVFRSKWHTKPFSKNHKYHITLEEKFIMTFFTIQKVINTANWVHTTFATFNLIAHASNVLYNAGIALASLQLLADTHIGVS